MPTMSRRSLAVQSVAIASFAFVLAASNVRAQEDAGSADTALARQVSGARVSLSRGLAAASSHGKPISAKYEMDDGKPQLSVYTAKGDRFWEVIVDHHTGRVAKAEEIKEGDDLSAARSQSDAMAKAKRSLSRSLARALRANKGYRAVSVTPAINDARPVATIRLVRGGSFKTVSEPLD